MTSSLLGAVLMETQLEVQDKIRLEVRLATGDVPPNMSRQYRDQVLSAGTKPGHQGRGEV